MLTISYIYQPEFLENKNSQTIGIMQIQMTTANQNELSFIIVEDLANL